MTRSGKVGAGQTVAMWMKSRVVISARIRKTMSLASMESL
jgi:hypothetical protein